MRKIMLVACALALTCFFASCGNTTVTTDDEKTTSVILNNVKTTVTYKISQEQSRRFNGNIDFYNCDVSALKNTSLVEYPKVFSEVPNEESAVKIAAEVFTDIYEDCLEHETPFVVHYNKNANSWLVNGTLPPDWVGGVGEIAIEKNTGEILMLLHTK